MARWWHEIDWNWRNFGWQEWVFGAGFLLWLVVLSPLLLLAVLGADGVVVVLNLLVVVTQLFLTASMFWMHNRRRRGIPTPEFDEPDPGHPISVGALQAILGGGFLVLAVLIGLLVWIGR